MKLTRYQVEMAVYAMYQAIELSKLVAHARVRPEVHDVLQELNDLLDVTCAREIESDTAAEELKSQNLIGSAKVAEILECTPQWVRPDTSRSRRSTLCMRLRLDFRRRDRPELRA